MSKNEKKKVSNLTLKICKAIDIINSKDFNKIRQNLHFFRKIDDELTIQIRKYASIPDYKLDFMVSDIADLSLIIYEYIKNFQQKFLYSKYEKHFDEFKIITDKEFTDFTVIIADEMTVDTILREVYKSLSYKAIMYKLWSSTENKKAFDEQITDLLKSFL